MEQCSAWRSEEPEGLFGFMFFMFCFWSFLFVCLFCFASAVSMLLHPDYSRFRNRQVIIIITVIILIIIIKQWHLKILNLKPCILMRLNSESP